VLDVRSIAQKSNHLQTVYCDSKLADPNEHIEASKTVRLLLEPTTISYENGWHTLHEIKANGQNPQTKARVPVSGRQICKRRMASSGSRAPDLMRCEMNISMTRQGMSRRKTSKTKRQDLQANKLQSSLDNHYTNILSTLHTTCKRTGYNNH
jgi:hypothetical protein